MKRGEPMRRTAIKAGTKPLARTSTLKTTTPMARGTKRLAPRSKTNSDPRPKTGEAELCRGQPCYLRIPGVCCADRATVVPAHSNQQKHGKGRSIKAHDRYTVPACFTCHAELDQGASMDRTAKFALWDRAYAEWEPVRAGLK
jgi:hypothetical protein